MFYIPSLSFSKLAVLAFYWRIFNSVRSAKVSIIVLAVIAILWLATRVSFLARIPPLKSVMTASWSPHRACFPFKIPIFRRSQQLNRNMKLVLNVLHCIPVHAYWDASVLGARCPYRDPPFYHGNVSLQYIHLLADIALLIIPALQVQKLRLNRSKKFGLTALFMFGIFVCAATISVIVYSTRYDPSISTEFSWSVASIFIWTIAEVNLAIASGEHQRSFIRIWHAKSIISEACLPLLRPLFKSIVGDSASKSRAPPRLPTLPGYRRKDLNQNRQLERVSTRTLRKANVWARFKRARKGPKPDEIEMRAPRPDGQGRPGLFDGTPGSEVAATTQEPSTCHDYSTSAIVVKSELSVEVARAL